VKENELTRRTVLRLMAAGAAGSILAACTPKAPATEAPVEATAAPVEEPVEEATAAPVEEAPTEAPPAAEAVELELVYHTWPGWPEVMAKISEMYQAKSGNVTVKYNSVDFGQLTTAMTPRFAAQEPPDLIIADGQWPWTQQGQLLDLTPLVDRDGMDLSIISDIAGGQVVADPAKGQYGLPLYLVGSVIYWNKTMFDKYSVAHPAEGWTLEDFKNATLMLARDANDNSPLDAGWDPDTIKVYGHNTYGVTMFEPFIKTFGGRLFDYDTLTCLLDDPKTIEAFTWINEMACKDKAVRGPGQADLPGGADAFVSQVAAMQISGDWMFSAYQPIADFDWDVASIPEGPAGPWCYGASNTLGIPKDGKHTEDAWGFLKFFCWDKAAQLEAGTSVGPALLEAATAEEFIALKAGQRGPNLDNVRWCYEQMHGHTTAEFYNMTRNSQQWNPIYSDLDVSIFTLCDKDVATACADAAAQITEIIRKAPGEA